MRNAAPSQNHYLHPPAHAGFNPQNANLMVLNRPPSIPTPWPMNSINSSVPYGMQFGLQQQQFQNFNAFNPFAFAPGFNQVPNLQQQQSNLQGMSQQSIGQSANQMVFNQVQHQQANGNLQGICPQNSGQDSRQNYNAFMPMPFTQGFNQITGLQQQQQQQQQVEGNLQGISPQNVGRGANQMVVNPIQHPQVNGNLQGVLPQNTGQGANQMTGLFQGPLFNMNSGVIPVNAAVLQQCLQSFMASNQLALGNPAANQPAVAGSMGFNRPMLAVDNVKLNGGDQQKAGGSMMNCWNMSSGMPVGPQNPWPAVVPSLEQALQAQNNLLSGGFQAPQQGSQNETKDNATSYVNLGKSTNPNFEANHSGTLNRGQSQGRFPNPRSFNTINRKGNYRQFAKGREKVGGINWRQRHPLHENIKRDLPSVPRRSLSVTYTAEEVLRWREARKSNYPTKIKTEKKLKGVDDSETKSRREQLKEVLAKQAELGVEVAELPPNYLSDSEIPANARGSRGRFRDRRGGRFNAKFNKRRLGQDSQYPKRQRHDKPENKSTPAKRSPTLLQKLLTAEIKRDKTLLLQVFRFMTLNSFFEQWPEKQLVYPRVTTRDCSWNEFLENNASLGLDGHSNGGKMDSIVNGSGKDCKVKEGEVGDDCGFASSSSSESDEEEDDEDSSSSESNEEDGDDSSGESDDDKGLKNLEKSEEGEITA